MRELIRKLSRLGDHSNEQEIQSKNAKKVPALPELSSRFRDFLVQALLESNIAKYVAEL